MRESPTNSTAAGGPPGPDNPPEARIVRDRRWSWAWLIPLGVLAILGVVGVQALNSRPVPVTVRFVDGAGLRPGDPVSCRGVQIGQVRRVRLAADAASVIVEIDLAHDAAGIAVEGTKLWIVRPEVSLRGVSGLDALLGPRSITVEPGPPAGNRVATFEGLADAPPLPAHRWLAPAHSPRPPAHGAAGGVAGQLPRYPGRAGGRRRAGG
ncbi:MAG: MCE family protein [Phycisphaerales bacterium]|nr:MCE family protein [Phycisphaerales bacterium]